MTGTSLCLVVLQIGFIALFFPIYIWHWRKIASDRYASDNTHDISYAVPKIIFRIIPNTPYQHWDWFTKQGRTLESRLQSRGRGHCTIHLSPGRLSVAEPIIWCMLRGTYIGRNLIYQDLQQLHETVNKIAQVRAAGTGLPSTTGQQYRLSLVTRFVIHRLPTRRIYKPSTSSWISIESIHSVALCLLIKSSPMAN